MQKNCASLALSRYSVRVLVGCAVVGLRLVIDGVRADDVFRPNGTFFNFFWRKFRLIEEIELLCAFDGEPKSVRCGSLPEIDLNLKATILHAFCSWQRIRMQLFGDTLRLGTICEELALKVVCCV
jgi:hypothetical protein